MTKPILSLDFDGVIHSYTSGWQGAAVISDPPVAGAIAFLREAVKHFRVAIFSSRSHQEGGVQAMAEWLGHCVAEQRLSDDEDLAWASAIEWPLEKPSAMIGIDDRVLTFTGVWPDMPSLLAFKPWNKKPPLVGTVFKKRPVIVEAALWKKNGDHPMDYAKPVDGLEGGEMKSFSPEHQRANDWEGQVVRRYRRPDDSGERACQHCGGKMNDHGWIDTLEGGHIVCPGDWVITGVKGERYPCKPDIFADTYEPA